jgi:hypothetical protein
MIGWRHSFNETQLIGRLKIGNDEVYAEPYDCYAAISFELGEIHDIYITSEKPVKAILQWLQLAA